MPRYIKLQEFLAHAGNVNCVHIGRKSSGVLVTGGDDKKVNLWTIGTQTKALSLTGHQTPVDSVTFDQGEEVVAAGASSGSIKLFDLDAAKVQRAFTGHRSNVLCLVLNQYGMLSGSMDTNVKLWDVRRKDATMTCKGHKGSVSHVRFSPDGKWIASASDVGEVKLFDMTAGRYLSEWTNHTNAITGMEFHPFEYLMATSSADKTIKVWDLESMSVLESTPCEATGVRAMCFHNDGKHVFSAVQDGLRVWSWDPPPCIQLDNVDVPWSKVADIALMDDKRKLVGVSYSQSFVGLWVLNLNDVHPFGDGLGGSATSRSSFADPYGGRVGDSRGVGDSRQRFQMPNRPPPPAMSPTPSPGVRVGGGSSSSLARAGSTDRDPYADRDRGDAYPNRSPSAGALSSFPPQPTPPSARGVSAHSMGAQTGVSAGANHSPPGATPTGAHILDAELAGRRRSPRSVPGEPDILVLAPSRPPPIPGRAIEVQTTLQPHKGGGMVSVGVGVGDSLRRPEAPGTPLSGAVEGMQGLGLGSRDTPASGSGRPISAGRPVSAGVGSVHAANNASSGTPSPYGGGSNHAARDMGVGGGSSAASAGLRGYGADEAGGRGAGGPAAHSETEGQAVARVLSSHEATRLTLTHRLTHLQAARSMILRNDVRGAMSTARRCNDGTVTADLLAGMLARQGAPAFSLDTVSDVVSAVEPVLMLPSHRHVTAGLEAVSVILRSFGPLIQDACSGAARRGVDIVGEERRERCQLARMALAGLAPKVAQVAQQWERTRGRSQNAIAAAPMIVNKACELSSQLAAL